MATSSISNASVGVRYVQNLRQTDTGVPSSAFDDSSARLDEPYTATQLWQQTTMKPDAPFSSASLTIHSAALSLTDPPGFMNSALPKISQPVSSDRPLSLSSGVLPTAPQKPSIGRSCAAPTEDKHLFCRLKLDPKAHLAVRVSGWMLLCTDIFETLGESSTRQIFC